MSENEVDPIKPILEEEVKKIKEDESKGKWGGYRPSAGRPKGAKNKSTLEKQVIKKAFEQRILKNIDRMFNAQLNLAVGEQVLMVKVREKDEKGKVIRTYHEQVTDIETIKEFLDEGDGSPTTLDDDDNWYYLSIKPANNQALEGLLNRGLGKAPDKLEVSGGFFVEDNLKIEVIGSRHERAEIGDDGQIIEGETVDATPSEPETGSGTETPGPSSDS